MQRQIICIDIFTSRWLALQYVQISNTNTGWYYVSNINVFKNPESGEFFTPVEMSPFKVKGCKFTAIPGV
jgi:hypothetical protein